MYKYLVFALFLGCAEEGTTADNRSEIKVCTVAPDRIVCAGQEFPTITECTGDTTPVVEEGEDFDTPIVVHYHGVVCKNLPIVSIGESKFIIYQNKLNLVEANTWTTVYYRERKGKVSSCEVRLTKDGYVKGRHQ